MQWNVALHECAHTAGARAQTRGEVFHPGSAEVYEIFSRSGWPFGERHGREKHGNFRSGFAREIRLKPQRLRIFNVPSEHDKLAPVETLAERHKIQQRLFERLRIAATARLRGQVRNSPCQ